MVDRRPDFIVRCAEVADVRSAVNFARQENLTVAVRGGGHNGAGFAVCDHGLVIDRSPMKAVRVDPVANTVRAEAGCTQADLNLAAQGFGLAVPAGVISTTGIAGLTLGGGTGYLTRKYGLALDNLLEAEVVLSDGRFVTASAKENDDLFWAVRGGGGNFGVVTSFLFQGQPVHTVYGGPMFWRLEDAAEVTRWYRDFIVKAPDDVYGFFAFHTIPPTAPFPERFHRMKMCGIVWCSTGPIKKAEKIFKPIRKFKTPAIDLVGPIPHPSLQSLFDGLYPPGMQWYWKADFIRTLPDEAIAQHLKHAATLPTLQSTMHLYPINGAAGRVKRGATAWWHRDANWTEVIVGVDPDRAKKEEISAWAKEYWSALHPYSAGGAYINFMMDEGEERIRATYGKNYKRLAKIKKRYDPGNLFRVNQNIRPR